MLPNRHRTETRRRFVAPLLLVALALAGAAVSPVQAKDDKANLRKRIGELERERKQYESARKSAQSVMDKAVTEAKSIKPKLETAKTNLERRRSDLDTARQKLRDARLLVQQQIDAHPDVRRARERLADAEAARDRVREEQLAKLADDAGYRRALEARDDAQRRVDAAKAAGDAESLATASRELIEAGSLLSQYTEVRLLEDEVYRQAVESVAAAQTNLRTTENRAEAEVSESGSLASTGQALTQCETDWRNASAEVRKLRSALGRAESVYNNADRQARSAQAKINDLNRDIEQLQGILRRTK